jgi:hypothetical protein
VAAEGHRPFVESLALGPLRLRTLEVMLERDLSAPLFRSGFSPHLYAELVFGLGWAPSFGGSADAACSQEVEDLDGNRVAGCSDRSRPFGGLAGARLGYALREDLGVELFLGYLRLDEHIQRNLVAARELAPSDPAFGSSVEDKTSLRGFSLALSARYAFRNTPLGLRVWTGVVRARVETENSGVYTWPNAEGGVERREISLRERAETVWVPFIGPEVSLSFPFARRFVFSVSLAGMLLLPPDVPRTGSSPGFTEVTGRRTAALPAPDGSLELPREKALGTAFALLPQLALRANF